MCPDDEIKQGHYVSLAMKLSQGDACHRPGSLLIIQWCELHLPGKPVGGRQIAVALDKYPSENERRIVRRCNLCHCLRRGSLPARPADEIIAGPGSRGALADVGKIS